MARGRPRDNLAASTCAELLEYDPATGAFKWKFRTPDHFLPRPRRTPEHLCRAFNTRYAGSPAFTADNGEGYRTGTILNVRLKAHHVAWAIVHGAWPDGEIDHINGIRSDNRIANLRVVTSAENSRNRARRRDSISGVTGVNWLNRKQRWVARITHNYKEVELGTFREKADAIAARKDAERSLGFSKLHDREPV